MKKFLMMGFAIFACCITLCGCSNKENGGSSTDKGKDKVEYSMGPFELKNGNLADQKLDESIKLTDTNFTVDDNKTSFATTVSNVSSEKVEIYELHIIIKNNSGEEIIRFKTRVNDLEVGESKKVETSMDSKLDGYKTVQYEIVAKAE